LLGRDPDVDVLRQRIGRDIRDRLAAALAPNTDPEVVDSLEMLYSGALVRAGMGQASYADIARRLEKSARLMLS
ncbi:MAG: transcriptional regulator, partial [Mycobacterium sp.]|nr:transcriptional regulator [Mycobacterium sp.]